MIVAKHALLLLLCHLLLHLPEAHSKCPKSFSCGNFFLEFPFTKSSYRNCGLFIVDNCDSKLEIPTILNIKPANPSYHILGKTSPNKFLIHDKGIQDYLTSPKCVGFTRLFLPQSPFVSFTSFPNITLFTCYNIQTPQIHDYFQSYRYLGCGAFTVYYKTPPTHHDHAPAIPPGCRQRQLPIKSDDSNATELSHLLTPIFTLEWNVSQQCYECYHGGGQCLNDKKHQFYCETADPRCPISFDCGNFFFEFPFTNTSSPGCGLITLHDCEYGTPTISSGHNYTIMEKTSSNQFLVHDTQIQRFLTNQGCLMLANLSMPRSYPISFTYSPNITLFTCFNHTPNDEVQVYFKNYRSFRGDRNHCQSDFTVVYYNISIDGLSEMEKNRIPIECLMIQLPVKAAPDADDLLSLLTPNFTLEWNVPEDCSPNINRNEYDCNEGNTKLKKILFIGGMTIVSLASTLVILFICIRSNRAKAKQKHEKDIELFLKNNGNLAPMRYKYSTIKKMTKSFSQNLGKGGYGSVYKGRLPDGQLTAVKVLNKSNGNGEDFMNEVASISRTSHINIVALLGFCYEGSKRALIYDFMPNGSLEKFIGNDAESALGWEKLFEIALGIARGLEYLHQGCSTRILHLDIKPQNILLDKDMNPRISDFGLAKLCPNRASLVSMMVARGTIGYIAPEVFSRNFGEVSYKCDVYSYGMLVLEMVGGKKNIDQRGVDHTSEIYFPHYIYKELEANAERDGDLAETMDNGDERELLQRKLMIVGLWCIQTNPKDRPTMTKVVEMMDGKLGSLEVPPKPYLNSPPRSAPSFSISESF